MAGRPIYEANWGDCIRQQIVRDAQLPPSTTPLLLPGLEKEEQGGAEWKWNVAGWRMGVGGKDAGTSQDDARSSHEVSCISGSL